MRAVGKVQVAFALLALALAFACSGEDPESSTPGLTPFDPANPAAGGSSGLSPVANYDRPLGMPIGQGASGALAGEPPSSVIPSAGASADPANNEDIEIPEFEVPDTEVVPCSGCIQISAVINDINQGADFVLPAGGALATRVVWTVLFPFHSDQLFIRSVINSRDGEYTFMSFNRFPGLNTPHELVQAHDGSAATTIGIRIGSAGAWTGNDRISVFVDSVTIETDDPSTTRTLSFDADAQGMVPLNVTREQRVDFHP